MNRIIRINKANRVAIVEPGVTYSQLQAELAKEGLSAYLPLAPKATKSVLVSGTGERADYHAQHSLCFDGPHAVCGNRLRDGR
jgi:hypothetical protein